MDVRHVKRVDLRTFLLLMASGHVIREITDSAAHKVGHILCLSDFVPPHEVFDDLQSIAADVRGDADTGVCDTHRVTLRSDNQEGVPADVGVASPALAALHTFQDIAVLALTKLHEQADGCFQITSHFQGDWH